MKKPRFKRLPSLSLMPLLALGLALFVAWAAFFEIDQSVRAQGQVIANSRTQIIQAADGGILSALYVHEGQQIQAGQVLAVLEKDRAQAGYQESQARVAALKAGLIRLKAELAGSAPVYGAEFSPYPEFVAVQKGFFEQRRRSLREELSVIKEAIVMAQDELRMHETLLQTGDVSQLEVMRARRQLTELQGRKVVIQNKYLQDARAESVKTEEELSSQQYKLTERQSVLDHTSLTAPIPGIVKYLRITTIGGVLRPGDELMQIAPSEGGLVIEVKINPADVGQLRIGLPASIKLDAFDYAIYGTLEGELIHISPDTLTEQGPGGQTLSFYRAHVRIPGQQSHNLKAKDIAIKLGMSASVDIRTGQRPVLTYLIKPLSKSFNGALREK